MKTLLAVAALLFFAATASADIDGAWTAQPHEKDPNKLQLSISYNRSNNHGNSYTLAQLGLTREQVYAAAQTPVQFAWKRAAGTATFDGVFRNGRGGGQMVFAPNRQYLQEIKALGVEIDMGAEDDELFMLALVDVSPAYIRSMQAEGFRVPLEEYMSMAMFGVTQEYIREMRTLVGRNVSAEKLVELRIHKVTPEYIREMRASHPELSLDDLVESRIFKVTPEFAAEMARAGYPNLSHDDLVQFRIHKVTPEYIRELAALGYKNLSADRLVEMRIFKVTPEFIRQLAAAGYRNVPVQKLIDMRMHKIGPEFLEKMSKAPKKKD
jgi:hypothetical protein